MGWIGTAGGVKKTLETFNNKKNFLNSLLTKNNFAETFATFIKSTVTVNTSSIKI